MHLARLQVEGFRGLSDRTFDFVAKGDGRPSGLVLITGGAGAGKTSFLEAIVASLKHLVGPKPAAVSLLRHGAKTGRLVGSWSLTDAEAASVRAPAPVVVSTSIFGNGTEDSGHPDCLTEVLRSPVSGSAPVVYFHASRLLPAAVTSGSSTSELNRDWLESTSSKFATLRRHVVDSVLCESLTMLGTLRERGIVLGPEGLSAHEQLARLMRPFLIRKTFDGVDDFDGHRRIRFLESNGNVLDLDQLSASEKQGLLFALTFDACRLRHAIVLIDMPELHIAPMDQEAFFDAIRGLGQDNQIFAATSSAALLGSVRPAQIIDLSKT